MGFPLLKHDRLDAIVAVRRGQPMTAERFLRDVAALAEALPARRHVVNLCRDRYRFAVGLAAALQRGQISLLPPNEMRLVLEDLASDYQDIYCLTEGPRPDLPLPILTFPEDLASNAAPSIPAFPEEQPAIVLFTSGSTGRPMPNPRCWGVLAASAAAAGRRLGIHVFPGATIVGTVPAQHSYGLESTVLLALQHGLAFHSECPFFPTDVTSILESLARPRILVTTPIHLRALLSNGDALPDMALVISATAPLAPQLAARAEARFSCPLLEIYGCSETGQLAARRPVESAEWRCFDGIALRQQGDSVCASGAPVAAEVPLGDVIELFAPDRFLLHGRSSDLVNIAGKRSSLAYLNFHLNSIEGVQDAVFVMPKSDEIGLARLMAFVVAPGISAETILSVLRQRIDPVFLPRPLRIVDSLPRNALGKLPHEQIQRMVAAADAS